MAEKNNIEFKVLRKNQYGHRFILEPNERIKFREKCKHRSNFGSCDKGYKCHIDGGVLIGCTPDVSCPRLWAWDKRHGLERSYTMVENEYPDLKPTTFTWHPATQSPGTRRVVIAFRVKGHENDYMLLKVVRFCSKDVTPATCAFKTAAGEKQLAVAWAYYDEITKGIADWMVSGAEYDAWAWWPDKEEENDKKE